MRAALWAAFTGALAAVPETEPGWLWAAGHAASSILVAYLLMCLIDVAWMRALCALAPGSYACGGVTLTAWTEEPMPPGGDPNMAVLPGRPDGIWIQTEPVRGSGGGQAPAEVREALGVPEGAGLTAADLVVWANTVTWELLDAVDNHLAGEEER